MANRFYECVMANVLMLYDFRCLKTLEECGYSFDVTQIVHNNIDAQDLIKYLDSNPNVYKTLLKIQQSNIEKIIKERNEVLLAISNIIKG